MELKITPSGQTIVKPTALGPGANTDTKLLIYGLFQKGRVLAQDEVLVNFDLDRPRARCAAAAFVELSRTNQVLVLTCHEWIVDLFRGAAPDAAVIDLSAVWAAP